MVKKTRKNITALLLLAMLVQIVAPVVIHSDAIQDAFRVGILDTDLADTKIINWEYDFDLSKNDTKHVDQLDIRLESEDKGILVDDASGIEIGEYKISTDGQMQVYIHDNLDDQVRKLLGAEKNLLTSIIESEGPEPTVSGNVYGLEEEVEYSFMGGFEVKGVLPPEGMLQADMVQPFAEVEENLVTSFVMIITENGGDQIPVENGDDLELDVDNVNAVMLKYGITKPDAFDITPGDIYTIDLHEIYGGKNASGMSITIDGDPVATYDIIDGEIIITFNANVNNYDNVEMIFFISGSFHKEIFEKEEEVVVEVPFSEEESYRVTLRPKQEDYEGEDKKTAGKPYILKEGKKVETSKNPTHVDWTVRVNDSMESFEKATVIDDLGENLKIVEDSFIIEKIIRNFKNEIIGREPVDLTPTITDNGFELNLELIEDAYDITYTTKIIRPDGGATHTINNNARIILDGEETPVSDNFEGTWSGDIPTLKKSGSISNMNADIIDWQVEYNYGKEDLGSDVILTDTLTHGQVILETVKVVEVETNIDGEKIREIREVTVESSIVDGKLIIPNLDANGKAYYITFQSEVPLGLNDETITNTIEDNLNNKDNASITVNTIPTGGKVGEQKVDEAGKPYIEWTITMNSKKVDISTISVKDVFSGAHLEFDATNTSLFELYENDVLIDSKNYSVTNYTHDDSRIGFHLNITDAGPHIYEFVYRTYYTVEGMKRPELANDAELIFRDGDDNVIGEGEGEGVSVDFEVTGPNAGISKFGQYITNEDKTKQEIKWTVTFNQSNILLNAGTTLTDNFTSGNYTYIDGSVIVSGINNYTFKPNEDKQGFLLTLNEATKATITVTFRTTVDDSENLQHENKATLNWQGGKEEATHKVAKRDPKISKSGKVVINEDGTKQINWTIEFNKENSRVIKNFKLEDTNLPASSQLTNIEVYRNNVRLTKSAEEVDGDYTLTYPENKSFVIEIPQLDAVPYKITYTSSLSPEEEQLAIKNMANIIYVGGTDEAEKTILSPELLVEKQANGINREGDNPVISWTIQANTDSKKHYVNLVNAILTDTIPKDQKLVKDSVQAVRADNSSIVVDKSLINESDNSFSINLPNGPYQYTVTFDTEILQMPSLDPDGVFDRYNNETKLINQPETDLEQTDDAKASIRYYDGVNNALIGKTGKQNDDTENIDYQVTINPEGLTIHNAVISDILSDLHQYVGLVDEDGNTLSIEDSIRVKDANGIKLVRETDYKIKVADNKRSFTIGLGNIAQPYTISYSTRLNANLIGSYDVTNTIKLTGGIENTELKTTKTETSSQQWFYGGGGSGRTLDFSIGKVNKDDTPLSGAEFKLEHVRINNNRETIKEKIISDDSFLEFSGYRAGRYILSETEATTGYKILEKPIYFSVGYSETPDKYMITIMNDNWILGDHPNATAEGNVLRVRNDIITGEVKATKVWKNGPVEKPTVWFKLYRQVGDEEAKAVPEAEIKELVNGTREVNWENIEKYTLDGKDYTFSVREVDETGKDEDFEAENYEKAENGLEVSNHYYSPTDARAKAVKEWDGGPVEKPTVWFKLYRQVEGEDPEAVPISEAEIKELPDGITEVVWTGLIKTDNKGNEYIFSLKEVDKEGNDFQPDLYEKFEDGLTVTNTYVSPRDASALATKLWEDDSEEKPSIYFKLFRQADGGGLEEVPLGEAPIKELANGIEEVSWDNLTTTDKWSREYTFSVKEVDAEGNGYVPESYVKEEEGLTVTNKKIMGSLEITKVVRGSTRPLRGAEFTLYNKAGEIIAVANTDAEGKVVFEDLEYGKYSYEETRSPSGYYRDIFIYPITIEEDGVTIQRTVENRRRPTGPSGPSYPDPEGPRQEPQDPKDPENPLVPVDPTDPDDPIIPTDPTDPNDFEDLDGKTPQD